MTCSGLAGGRKRCDQPAWAIVTQPGHNVMFVGCKAHAPLSLRDEGYLVRTFKKGRQ